MIGFYEEIIEWKHRSLFDLFTWLVLRMKVMALCLCFVVACVRVCLFVCVFYVCVYVRLFRCIANGHVAMQLLLQYGLLLYYYYRQMNLCACMCERRPVTFMNML